MTLDSPAALIRPASGDTVYLAPGSITLPITVRSWLPGDRMRPLGFNCDRKLKAVFADARIPVRLRGSVPVLESGGRIVCAGTLRIAEHCRVSPGSLEVIAVSVTSPDQNRT